MYLNSKYLILKILVPVRPKPDLDIKILALVKKKRVSNIAVAVLTEIFEEGVEISKKATNHCFVMILWEYKSECKNIVNLNDISNFDFYLCFEGVIIGNFARNLLFRPLDISHFRGCKSLD